jgi:hypothetical protein
VIRWKNIRENQHRNGGRRSLQKIEGRNLKKAEMISLNGILLKSERAKKKISFIIIIIY